MSIPPNYRDRKLVNSAYESILKVIRPGDVVAQVGTHRWWQLSALITHLAIQYYQRRLLGSDSNWHDTHVMLYLDENNTFSIEMPRATLKPLREYCLSNLSIYRLRLPELTPDFIETMKNTTNEMVGEYYDVGQALDIAINGILGYTHQRRLKIFDLGRERKVCSVGVRVAFEYLYKSCIKIENSKSGKWLFQELNPGKFPEKITRNFTGTDVEVTAPAHFANSDYFFHEFDLIAKFDGGKQVFQAV